MINYQFERLRMNLLKAILLPMTAAAVGAQLPAFVNEGPGEFSAAGDFNGDGAADLVLVDRSTGAFRIGYNNGAGGYNWADPRATGMEDVDAVTIGRLLQTTRDSLAVASVAGNRINLFDVPNATSAAVPASIFPSGVGPNFAVAIDIPGTAATTHADVFAATSQNNAPNTGRYTLLRNNAGAATILLQTNYPVLASGNRFVLQTAGPDLAGAVARTGTSNEFRVFLPGSNSVSQVAAIGALPLGTRYGIGNFAGGIFNHSVLYTPGQSSISSYLASRPAPPNYLLTSAGSFNLGAEISQLIVLPGASTARLAAIFQNGSARIYNFNGASAPTLVQEILPEAGEKITSLVPTGGQEFVAFSGAGNTSTHSRRYTVSGAGYTAGPRTTLPSVMPLSIGANVFLFQAEPFVSPAPGLLRSVNAGDWTSDLTIVPGAPATYNANVWNFVSPTEGLRNPTPVNFGAVAPTASFGLVNQYTNFISIFSRAPAVGNEVVEISVNPPPGEYKTAINVALSTALAGAQLYYRTSSNTSWTLFTTSFTLFKTTTLQYYGVAPGGSNSRIHTAEYIFPISPATQDSDRDGIPDYVEIAKGLNPNGGRDQDGDGFTDLNELIEGTDPTNKLNFPAEAQRLEEKAAFDLLAGLQPLNGTTGSASQASTGVGSRVYDLSGSIFRAETTINHLIVGITDPSLRFTNLVVTGEPSLVAVGTDPHFDIVTASTDKRIGRELISLVEAPRPDLPDVPYVYGGGAILTEASAWITAAQTLYNSLPREEVLTNLDINDTLVSLLFERKISEILLQRGNSAGSNLTLFPFRPTDSGRTNPPLALLASLESRVSDSQPGYKLGNVLSNFTSMVAATNPAGMDQLKSLTADIYRISSLSNNAAPAAYPSPVNVLRDFLETGNLHSNYFSARNPTINLPTAYNASTTAIASVTGRPTATVNLVVRADTFGGSCTVLDTEDGPVTQMALVHPGGVQYRLLESFNLVPGTQIQVFGYTDAAATDCSAASAIEVISLALDAVPAVSAVDTDGDLLLDALELLLFGSLGNNGAGDSDGDGYGDVQEFIDGTDPEDAGSHGASIVNLDPPSIEITEAEGGSFVLTFNWPANYIDDFTFLLQSTTDLGDGFASEPVVPQMLGPNQFRFVLTNPGSNQKFYILQLQIQ